MRRTRGSLNASRTLRWAITSLTALVCACAIGNGAGRESHVALAADAVVRDDELGWIVDLALVGERIVGIDAMPDPSVHVFDRQSLRRLASYGRTGDGPGEFRDPEQIVVGASGSADEILVLDGVHQRLTSLSLGEIESGTVVEPETHPMDGPNAGSLVRAPDGRWFAGGWIMDGRVARYDVHRSYDRTVVGFPPEAEEAPGTTLPQAYESRVVTDPAGHRLAAATLLGGLLEIFDYDGRLIARAAVPDPFQPSFLQGRARDGRAVMSVGPETRYGFTDLAATRRYLYGLFSGGRVMQRGAPWSTEDVQAYTWTGEYVRTLRLGRTAQAITVETSDTWLYASGSEPSPWIGRFRLPAEVDPPPLPPTAAAGTTAGRCKISPSGGI